MHCMRRNTPISIPNVALRGIANSPDTLGECLAPHVSGDLEDGTRVKMMTSAAGRAADHVSMDMFSMDMFSENISMLT